jgi:hypothetical protein
MHYRPWIPLILLAGVWPFIGCGQRSIPPAPPAPPNSAARASGAPASYSIEVRSESGNTQKTVSGDVDVTIDNVHLQVRDGALTVNERSHGQINGGDAVLVQPDGQVLVNVHVRVPR